MKLMFIGTSAATSCPLAFCNCAACREGRKRGGRDLRRRASVLIDDRLLIDMGPDLMTASFEFGFDAAAIRYLLQTHSHSDHFDPGHFITRIAEYATENLTHMSVCASPECIEHMSEKLGREEEGATLLDEKWRGRMGVDVRLMKHGDRIRLDEYEVIAVESAHDPGDGSLLYIIRKGDSAFMYACDTPLLTDRAWALIESLDFPINAAACDQTYGPGTPGGGHMHAEQTAEFAARMAPARVFATHISHEGTPPHAELEKWTRARGYEVAYDGLVVEI